MVKMLVEVGPEDLIIRAPAPRTKAKVMGREPLAGIARLTVEHIAGGAQRLEILHASLLRMALVGGIALAFTLVVRAYPLHYGLLIALAVAAFVGPLNFVLRRLRFMTARLRSRWTRPT